MLHFKSRFLSIDLYVQTLTFLNMLAPPWSLWSYNLNYMYAEFGIIIVYRKKNTPRLEIL